MYHWIPRKYHWRKHPMEGWDWKKKSQGQQSAQCQCPMCCLLHSWIGWWVHQHWSLGGTKLKMQVRVQRRSKKGCVGTFVLKKKKRGGEKSNTQSFLKKWLGFSKSNQHLFNWQDMPTPSNWSSLQELTGCETHMTVPQGRGTGAWAEIGNYWWNTPWHSLPHHPPNTPSFSLFSRITQHALTWDHSAKVPTSFFGECVSGMLSVGALTEPHMIYCESKNICSTLDRLRLCHVL